MTVNILILALTALCFLYAFQPMRIDFAFQPMTDPDLVFRFARKRVLDQHEEGQRLAREQKLLYQVNPEVARRLEEESRQASAAGNIELAQAFSTAAARYRPSGPDTSARF